MSEQDILNHRAVSRRSDKDAAFLLTKYIGTNPTMALNHTTPEPTAAAAPKGGAAGNDPLQK
jgi:hypothetical protein